MLTYSPAIACFEHSNFLTVKDELLPAPQINVMQGRPKNEQTVGAEPCGNTLSQVRHRFNYELFNCNNFNIRYWSWNYRGCWHQTCPPIDP